MPLPHPSAKDTQDDFIGRFMADPAMQTEYPDQKQRAAVAYKQWRSENGRPVLNDDDDDLKEYLLKVMGVPAGQNPRNNARGQFAEKIPMRFISPGLVNYKDTGNVMVDKPALDRMARTFEGKPIFNEMHKDVSKTDFKEGRADGIIANVRYEQDGWYWCDALIWDPETQANCRNGYSLSCAYDVTQWGPGGVNNNIPYDREVLDGEYTHMAIVPNPRYERAKILINSKGGLMTGLLKWFTKDKDQKEIENSIDLDKVQAKDAAGADVPLKEMVEFYNSKHPQAVTLGDNDLVDVGGGRKVAFKDIKASYSSRNNADDDEKAKKEKEESDRKNAEEKEKADKDEKEKANRKNAEEHEKGEHKDKEMDNCASCSNEKERKNALHFEELRRAAHDRDGKFEAPKLTTTADKVAEGLKRYGPKS